MHTSVFHLQNLSALHVGTGQGIGVVDLPIARAKSTNLPIVPGSAIKGVLRDELAVQNLLEKGDIQTLFGPDTATDDAHAGAIAFGDEGAHVDVEIGGETLTAACKENFGLNLRAKMSWLKYE